MPIGGKPLIQYTLEAGAASSRVSRLILTSDDNEIIAFARRFPIDIPFVRPKTLAGDQSSSYDVVMHCLDWLEEKESYRPDAVLILQPTCPFRDGGDIDGAVDAYLRSNRECLVAVSRVFQHPCDCIKLEGDGIRFADQPIEGRHFPEYYFISGAIYITSAAFLREKGRIFDEKPELFFMSKEHSLDIDESFELRLADSLLHYSRIDTYKEEGHEDRQ